MTLVLDDETLVAYADDELEPGKRAAVSAALEADQDARLRLAAFVETRRSLARAFGQDKAELVPDRLLLAAMGGGASARAPFAPREAVGGAARAKGRRAFSRFAPLAAALAMIVGGAAGYGAAQFGAREEGLSRPVAAALSDRAGGETAGPVRVGDTYRLADGTVCRLFTAPGERLGGAGGRPYDGLACRREGRWVLDVLAAAPEPRDGAFRPAAGPAAAIDAALDAGAAGEPLSPEAVRALMSKGWD